MNNPQNLMLGQLMNGMMGIKGQRRPQSVPQGGMMGNMMGNMVGGMQSPSMGFRPSQKMHKPTPNMAGMTNQQRIAQMLMGFR